MSVGDESKYYNANNKCCGTCKWHCENPNAPRNAIKNTWICGCPNNEYLIGHCRMSTSGKNCKNYEVRDNVSEWRERCALMARVKMNRRGKLKWVNLSTIAHNVLHMYETFKQTVNGNIPEALSITASYYKISMKNVKKCLHYAKGHPEKKGEAIC